MVVVEALLVVIYLTEKDVYIPIQSTSLPEAWKLSLGRLGWERCPGTKALGMLGAGVVRQGWKSEAGKGFLDGKVLGRLGWEGCPGTKVLGRLGWQAGWGRVCMKIGGIKYCLAVNRIAQCERRLIAER